MKDTMFYIDKLRKKTKKGTDYAVAKLLEIEQQNITHYKKNKSSLDNDIALKVGMHLGINPLEIIANIKASKSKEKEAIEEWKKLAEEISRKNDSSLK